MGSPPSIHEDVLRLDARVYHVDSVKRAAYRFIHRVAAEIHVDANEIVCRLTFTPRVSPETAFDIVADLQKEFLDQDLRRSIAIETAATRNTILALAFAPASLASGE